MKTSNTADIVCAIAEHDDQHAFRELFDLYSPGLLSYTVAVVKSRALAEEIVADVFVNLWKNRKNLVAIKNLTYYLYTANKNILLNHISKEKRFASISLDNIEYDGAYEYLNPEEICIGKANVSSILNIIKSLPPKCQLIFRLAKEEGLTYKEISQLLNITPKTVENQMQIALKKIMEAMKQSLPQFADYYKKKIN